MMEPDVKGQLESMGEDFFSALEQGDYAKCNVIIDTLRDYGFLEDAMTFVIAVAKARMMSKTVSA